MNEKKQRPSNEGAKPKREQSLSEYSYDSDYSGPRSSLPKKVVANRGRSLPTRKVVASEKMQRKVVANEQSKHRSQQRRNAGLATTPISEH